MSGREPSAIRGFCNFVALVVLAVIAIWLAPSHIDNPECTSLCLYTTQPPTTQTRTTNSD